MALLRTSSKGLELFEAGGRAARLGSGSGALAVEACSGAERNGVAAAHDGQAYSGGRREEQDHFRFY